MDYKINCEIYNNVINSRSFLFTHLKLRWTFKVHSDFAMGITRIQLLVDGREVTYKNSSLEEHFVTTVYVPEDIQRVKILQK